jgi:DNA-directed RNA polymerase subunit RPC12/RpoP
MTAEDLREDCRARNNCVSDEKCHRCSQQFICLKDIGELYRWQRDGLRPRPKATCIRCGATFTITNETRRCATCAEKMKGMGG